MARKGGTPENLKPFKKGQSGNPNGRPKVLPEITNALYEEIGEDGIRQVLQALHKEAKKGNVRAIQELLDRAYGKAQQKIDHTTGGDKLPATNIVFGSGQTPGE